MRLSLLIENVLDLGRLDRGERSYDLRSLDLNELVEEVVGLFRPIAEQAGMAVLVSGEAKSEVRGDRHALTQVLLNLLDNARKYGSRNRGDSGQKIRVRVSDGEVSVADEGPGLHGEDRELVFERFRRGERQRDGSVPGVGLGLYLAREIMRQHGGTLEVTDSPERAVCGACLVLRLPSHGDSSS